MPAFLSNRSRIIFAGVSLLVLLGLTSNVPGQTITDNFNDGNDTTPLPGWTHYAPLNQAPLPADNEDVSWTFPDVGFRGLGI